MILSSRGGLWQLPEDPAGTIQALRFIPNAIIVLRVTRKSEISNW